MIKNAQDVFLRGFRDEQARAITSSEPLVVVSAGAGTGKTQTLATRFAWLLATDPACRVEQILTLTFTEKAAREMQERIRGRLEEWYRGDPTGMAHLRDALERFDEGYISTIHSFAYRVVRESGLAMDLDPGATLLAPPEEEAFWEEFTAELEGNPSSWVAEGLDDPWGPRAREFFASADFVDLRDGFGASALASAVRETSELAASLGWNPEKLWDWSDDETLETLRKMVDPFARECWELWQCVLIPAVESLLAQDTTRLGTALKNLKERFRGEEAPDRDLMRQFFAAIHDALEKLDGAGKVKKLLEDTLGEGLKSWRDTRKEMMLLARELTADAPEPPEEKRLRQGLRCLAALGWERWDRWRRLRGGLIFRDLIAGATEVLQKDPEAAKRFRHIMVDEFQDTDPLQDALIRALWRPDTNTLFLVGDLKQSIYRFRHADLTLFGTYIDEAKKTPGDSRESYIPLPCSFRLRSSLLDEVNALFGDIWKDGLGKDLPLPYEALTGPEDLPFWKCRNASGGAPVEALLAQTSRKAKGEETSRHGTASEGRARCFSALAARFREIHDRPQGEESLEDRVWDKDGACWRAPRWSDFAVLVPSRGHYPLLEQAFDAAGIPVAFDGSRAYFSRGEVRDVVNLLKALARPEDDLALAGWSASPFSGVLPHQTLEWLSPPGSRQSLTAHAEAPTCPEKIQGPLSGASSRETSSESFPPGSLRDQMARHAPAAARRFDRLRRTARLKGASGALALLLEDPHALRAFGPSARRRVAANLRAAEALAREYETTLGGELGACAAYLDRALRKEHPREEPTFVGEDEDAVRVLTIHGAKGLEYPFVAVTGLERSPGREKTATITPSRHLGAVFSRIPPLLKGAPAQPPAGSTSAGSAGFQPAHSSPSPDMPAEIASSRGKQRDTGETSAKSEERDTPTTASRWHRLLERQALVEENWRLFYVATTRAREKLFLCGNISMDKDDAAAAAPKDSWLGPVRQRLGEDGTAVTCRILSRQDEEILKSPGKNPETAPSPAPADALPLPSPDPFLGRLGASAYALLRYCPRAYRRSYRQGITLIWDKKDDGPGGSLLGTLAHEVLRGWNFAEEELESWLPEDDEAREQVARRLPPDLRLPLGRAEDRRALASWLRALCRSAEGARLRGRTLRKEVVFRLPLGPRGGGPTVDLVGALDLLWEDDKGLHVRDYKTAPPESIPDDLYRHQLLFYGVVARHCRPGRPVDLALYHLRAFAGEGGDPVTAVTPAPSPEAWEAWDDGEWEAAWCQVEEELWQAARQAAQGPWPPRPEGCHRCPWKSSCAPE